MDQHPAMTTRDCTLLVQFFYPGGLGLNGNAMIDHVRRNKYPRYSAHKNTIPDWMGFPRSDYSRYDPYHEDRLYGDRKNVHELEGAGRQGWDYDQNRAYGTVYGNQRGPSFERNEKRRPDHRGKGPRNYKRTDERIMEDIIDQLTREQSVDLTELEIEVKDGEVFLSGRAHDRYIRHKVEDVTDGIPGVKHIENAIRVSR